MTHVQGGIKTVYDSVAGVNIQSAIVELGDGTGSAALNFKLLNDLGEGAIKMNGSEMFKVALADGTYIQTTQDISSTAKIAGAIIFLRKNEVAANLNEIYEAADDSDHIKAKDHTGSAKRLD